MNKPTLILPPRYTEDSNKIWKAAIDLGWDVERINWLIPSGFAPAKPVIYGEPLFNQFIAEQLGIKLIQPEEDFLAKIPYEYIKRNIKYVPVEQARKLKGPVFIKPPNNKTFPARVYESGEDLPNSIEQNEIVIASEVVWWLSEFRFFIYDRKIKIHSIYSYKGTRMWKNNGFPNTRKQENQCIKLVEELLSDETVFLPLAVVIDCGVIDERGPAIVEANEINGSGIYECEPSAVLEILEGVADYNAEICD